MSLGRAVPWASWAEWRQVGAWLLSEEPEEVQRGLDRVAAWRARGRVPLGVDSTACFAQAALRDARGGAAEGELRLQWGLAVVRMVNGIADSSQRGRLAASVAALAAAAGLPRILVDLRHEATHNELPSLAAARLAGQHALAWLQANYWRRQADHLAACVGRVQSMLQEYLQLQQAAAAKVAAAAESPDSDDSGGEEPPGGWPALAAAVPALAGDGGYQAADARKRRRQLLSELRSAVPRPAAALLADALLAAAAALELRGGAPGAAGGGPAGEAAVAERALAASMGHLCNLWPQLPQLVLLASVQRLAEAAEAEARGADGGPPPGAPPPAACLAWLRRLLPAPSGGAAAGVRAACGGWRAGTPLLRRLLGVALPAQAEAAQLAACRERLRSPGGAAAPSAAAAALQQAVSLLVAAARASPGGAALAAEAGVLSGLEAAAVVPPASAPQPMCVDGDVAQLAAAAGRQQALLQRLGQRSTAGAAGAKRAAGAQDGGAAKRWRRAARWQPCALGMLPCAADPNGQLPPLEARAAPQLAPAFLAQQAADAVAGAAQAAQRQAGASGSRFRQEDARESALPAAHAATTLGAAAAPWPADDRFARAAAASEQCGEKTGEGGPAAARSGPVLLPAVCAPLL